MSVQAFVSVGAPKHERHSRDGHRIARRVRLPIFRDQRGSRGAPSLEHEPFLVRQISIKHGAAHSENPHLIFGRQRHAKAVRSEIGWADFVRSPM